MDAIPIYVRVKPVAYWYRIDRSHLLHCQLMPWGSWPCVKAAISPLTHSAFGC